MTTQDHTAALTYADALRIARGCTDYGGGYRSDPEQFMAYQDGIQTVITALERADPQDSQTRALMAMGAQPQQPAGWRPIETAPREQTVMVYTPPQPGDWPGDVRITFDARAPEEDGDYWIEHSEHYEHYMAVGGSRAAGPDTVCTGPSEQAPYTHWMPLPPPPTAHPSQQEDDALDAARLDWLEAQINRNGAIHLHDGSKPYGMGLGLRPGSLVRTLRAAIDTAMNSAGEGGKNG